MRVVLDFELATLTAFDLYLPRLLGPEPYAFTARPPVEAPTAALADLSAQLLPLTDMYVGLIKATYEPIDSGSKLTFHIKNDDVSSLSRVYQGVRHVLEELFGEPLEPVNACMDVPVGPTRNITQAGWHYLLHTA
jgi:hypothetical protein